MAALSMYMSVCHFQKATAVLTKTLGCTCFPRQSSEPLHGQDFAAENTLDCQASAAADCHAALHLPGPSLVCQLPAYILSFIYQQHNLELFSIPLLLCLVVHADTINHALNSKQGQACQNTDDCMQSLVPPGQLIILGSAT